LTSSTVSAVHPSACESHELEITGTVLIKGTVGHAVSRHYHPQLLYHLHIVPLFIKLLYLLTNHLLPRMLQQLFWLMTEMWIHVPV
jgi:hypothetical protein